MPRDVKLARRWLWTPVALLILAAGSYAAYVALQPERLPQGFVYGNGRVEGTEVRLSSELAGRVSWSALVEGTPVAAGAPLVRIDPADLATVAARAEAESAAVARERTRLDAELRAAQHHRATAATDLARYRDLEARGTAPPQRREVAENVLQEADGRVRALEAARAALTSRVDAAGQVVALAQAQVGKTEIRAPLAATVLLKLVEPGEFVSPGQPLATLVDLSRLELKIYVPEAEIGRIKLDAPARVRVDALPERYFEARVARVDGEAQFTPRDVHMPDERSRLVFGVTLSLANPGEVLKPGMPADAWVQWQAGPWPARLPVPR